MSASFRKLVTLLLWQIGDLYKVTLDYEGDQVRDVVVTVFDTIINANSLCITRNGLLLAAAEFGDHALFQFSGIGDEDAVVAHKVWLPLVSGKPSGGYDRNFYLTFQTLCYGVSLMCN